MQAWEHAQSARDGVALRATYSDRIRCYGAELSGDECAKRAEAFFAKKPEQSFADLAITGSGATARAVVKKTVRLGASSKVYAQHLTIAEERGNWRITEETDETTNSNLAAMRADECRNALRTLFDPEVGPPGEVSVWVEDGIARIDYWSNEHPTRFEVDLASGKATRVSINRALDIVGSDPIKVDATKLSAVQTACART